MSSRFRKAMPWGSPRMGGSECRRKGLNVVMRHRKGRAPKTVFLLEAAWFEKEEKNHLKAGFRQGEWVGLKMSHLYASTHLGIDESLEPRIV